MTTLNINGRRVTVDDSFLSLSPEQQEATVNEIAGQIGATQADPRDSFVGKADAAVRGAADMLSLGFADEIAAGLGTGFGMLGDYDAELARQRGIDQSDTEKRFGYRLGGQLAGGVAGGVGLSNAGLSLATRAAQGGGGLTRVAAGSAADGGIMGGLYGFGSGEGAEGRAMNAAAGSAGGTAAGIAAPYLFAGLQAAASPVVRPIMSRLRPEAYASRALSDGLNRAGMSVDDVTDTLARASVDDQGMFMVADALGNSGQRMLSAAARTPHNARQDIVEALVSRQAGQGQRVSSAIDDAFGADATRRQSTDDLIRWASDASEPFYRKALAAKPVTSDRMKEFLADPIVRNGITKGLRIQRLEALAKGEKFDPYDYVTSFDEAGEPVIDKLHNMRTINVIKKGLDDILDAYRDPVTNRLRLDEEGRAIDAVRRSFLQEADALNADYGQARALYAGPASIRDDVNLGAAAAGRGRAADNIAEFGRKQPANQQGFRLGYADTLNQRIERSAQGVNNVRPLTSGKSRAELEAFALPSEVDRLGRRLGREQTMFATTNAALGGSKTADNLADMAEAAKFDPSILANLLAGRPVAAAMDAVGGLLREAKGMSPGVTERIARALIATDADMARQVLSASRDVTSRDNVLRALASAIVGGQSGAEIGRRKPLQITVTPR
jgi:hypothetical protein